MTRTILVIDGPVDETSEYTVAQRITLVLGDVCVIQSDGPSLQGDDALRWQVGQLEAENHRCHEIIGELRTLAADVSQATTMDDVYAAVVRYGGLDELLGIETRPSAVRRLWNTMRRRP